MKGGILIQVLFVDGREVVHFVEGLAALDAFVARALARADVAGVEWDYLP